MKIKSWFISLSLLSACHLSAQVGTTGSIAGTVVDTEGESLESVTLILLHPQDSSYISGSISDAAGEFKLIAQAGDYLLESSMIGYRKKHTKIHISAGHSLRLDTLCLHEETQSLSGVTITAQKQHIELEAGKMVVNLSSSPLSSQGNLLDALKNLPGIMIDNNGSIYLNGQQGIHVLINDQPTYLSGDALMNLLRSISASSVGKIELVSHPSARFDAAGNSGLINIHTQKEKQQGMSLSLSSGAKAGRYVSGHENASLSLRKEKINFYIDYSFYGGKEYTDLQTGRDFSESSGSLSQDLILEGKAKRYTDYRSHYVRSGLDYEVSSKLAIAIYGSYNWRDWNRDERTVSNLFRENGTPDPALTSLTNFNKKYRNLTGGATLSYQPTSNSQWDTSFDFQNFDPTSRMLQYSFSEQTTQKDTLQGVAEGDIYIYAVQSNFSNEFSERNTLTLGTKAAFISNDNTALYQNRENGSYIDNRKLSNLFFYDENVYAGYLQLNSRWSRKLSTEIGLRLEHTSVKGVQEDSERDSLFRQSYTHWFPTCMIKYQASENHRFAWIYSKRIVRPNYRDLNPFIEVNDRYLQEQGNTGLRPELTDNIEFSYFFRNRLGISLLYSYRKHPITKSYLLNDDDVTIVTPCNLSANHLAGLKIGINNLQLLKWWILHLNSSVMYKQFQWNMFDQPDTNRKVTPMIHLSNQLSLPQGWQAEITGFYNGQMAEGQAKVHTIWQVSTGVKKSFLKNKATLRIYANDIFSSNKASFDLYGPLMRGWYKESNDTRTMGVTFTYRFNSGAKPQDTRRENRMDESKRINL